jgi:RNA polymerase sigma factor (TIGR02999 family)
VIAGVLSETPRQRKLAGRFCLQSPRLLCRPIMVCMSDVTQILNRIHGGDPAAAEQLLPLVYEELRKLAAQKLTREKPGQTLQATALVHEAYLRLVDVDRTQHWDSRGHFFAAAAEAMRRILVDNARRKLSQKHGGGRQSLDPNLEDLPVAAPCDPLEVLAIHEALERLAAKSPRKAELVKLRYFLGCTMAEAAEILAIALKTAEEDWTHARAWLRREWLRGNEKNAPD